MLKNPEKGLFTKSYFLHLQHQTLAPSFAIVQTGSGLGQKILDIFVLETARVNGTYISESLRPTVTKKNQYPSCEGRISTFSHMHRAPRR